MLRPFSEFDPFGGEPAPDSLAAHLLVATPRLADPNFARHVVLVLDHGSHGAIGVVLDQPGGMPVSELLPAWSDAASPPAEVFTGGPVQRNAVIGLMRLDRPASELATSPPGWHQVVEGARPVGTVDLESDPKESGEAASGLRLFSGYAGWETRQLEREIVEGSWYVVPARDADPLSADPEGLWRRVLRRQGGALAVVSAFPPEPSVN